MNSAADVWVKVLSLMEQEMTSTAVHTWFDDSQAVELNSNSFVIYTPTAFKKNIIQDRYINQIKHALRELFASDLEVEILCEGELEQRSAVNPNKNPDNDNLLLGSSDYTFENFVEGSSNRFAYNAAIAVAEKPASQYNPLYIHGESGLGKTHLLYAISNAIAKNYPDYRICYVKGEQFTNEMIDALQKGTMPQFRSKYRENDLLLVDDVQFIAGKTSTQEEFFHTFNTLYEAKKQIVLAADRLPNEMIRLEDRLVSRFSQGLMADIQRPDYETRMAIVRAKATKMGLVLPNAMMEYIAENITKNVRQLEGTIVKILAYQQLMGVDLDVDTMIRAVRDIIREKDEFTPSADEIIEETAKYFRVEKEDILGQSRRKEVVLPRQISMHLIRHNTSLSLNDIGEIYHRDHSTVVHSLEKVKNLIMTEREIDEICKDITANINARNY